ncbi:MAG: acyltransferase family protein [Nocardioides sp.]
MGGFRPDIQGLRALAVLLVVVDHADIGPLHGGFIGVDVFFVISGFLITGLLLSEADRQGRISLAGFYARRAKRILPAATLVLATTVAAGYFLLNGIVALQLFKDSVWATFFAANIQFARIGVDYNAQEAATSPIQHYWSLAVEEQFYLVWPVVVLALVWAFRRRGRDRRAIITAITAISVASFAYALWYVGAEPKAAYFSTPARAWELGAGAATAALMTRVVRLPGSLLAGLSWLGLALVGIGALLLDSQTKMPGLPALLPVVGTVLLLAGGVGAARWGPQAILSLAPARWIGDRSYSYYLWHWPALIIMAEVWDEKPAGWSGLLVAAVALGVSDLTYRFVENPFRRARFFRPTWSGIALYPASVAVLGLVVFASHTALDSRFSQKQPAISVAAYGQTASDGAEFSDDATVALVEASVRAAQNGVTIPNPLKPAALGLAEFVAADLEGCEYFALPDPMPLCRRGDPDSDKVIVAVGDSHMRHWIPAIDVIASQRGYAAYYFVLQGCTPALVQPWTPIRDEPDEDCVFFHEWTQQQIQELEPDVVMMATDTQKAYVTPEGVKVGDNKVIASLIEQGMVDRIESVAPYTDRVIVLADPPRLQFDPAIISERGATLADGLSDPQPRSMMMRRAVKAATKTVSRQVKQRPASELGALADLEVDYVETRQWFCAYDLCPVVIGDYITHRDRGHMTLEYSRFLTRPLSRELALD